MSALRDAVEEYLALRRALGTPILAAASQLRASLSSSNAKERTL
jgi:hypothetical protein